MIMRGPAQITTVGASINTTVVSTATTLCITGVTRNPNNAKEVMVPFGSSAPVGFASDDVLSPKVLTRIGTPPGPPDNPRML
jgi:hypothetical protein